MSGSPGPAPWLPSRRRISSAALAALALAVISVLPAGAIGAPAAAVPATHVSLAAQELAQARAQAILPGAPPTTSCASACAGVAAAPHPAAATSPVWSNLQGKIGTAPTPRYLGILVYDPADQYVLLFGGADNSGPMSDTWTYANGVWTELSTGASPSARYLAFATWDPVDGYVLLFGGYDSSSATAFNDTWTFRGGVWNQLNPAVSPAERCRGALAFDPTDNYLVLYGGSGTLIGSEYFSDTWSFVGGTWTNLTKNVTGKPGPLFRVQAATDTADGYIVMFGGCTSSACNPTSSATWTYENLTWTKQTGSSSTPGGRAYIGITYDAEIQRVLMFGGVNEATNSAYGDTWEYSHGNWTQVTGLSPSPATRAFEMIDYDAYDGYAVLFGGQNPSTGTYYNDTWTFGPSVVARFTASPGTIDLGQSVALNATPLVYSGYVNVSYPMLPPGCLSANVTVLVCAPSATGVFTAQVVENDSRGSALSRSLTITVNTDPMLLAYGASVPTVTAGSRLWFNATVANGTPGYGYSWTGLPTGCSSTNTPSLSCVPSAAASGPYTVEVNVADAAAYHVFGNVTVTVNAKPAIMTFEANRATIDLGMTVRLYVNTTGGTAPLSYVYGGLPSTCPSVNAPVLACTPGATGTIAANVTVTDAFGWTATSLVTLQVNADPAIDGFVASPAAFDLGHATTVYFNASGGTGALSYAYTGLPPGCALGAAAGGTCTPTDNGTFTVTGKVSDSLGFSVQSTITLMISADPLVTGLAVSPGASVDVGQNFTVTVLSTGGTAPFSYSYTGLPLGCTGQLTAVVSCKPRASGSFTVTAILTDTWKETSQLATTVQVQPDPAISLLTVTPTSPTSGSSMQISVTVTGGSGIYTFAYAGLPAGCATRNASTLTCTPTATGAFNVTVNVTDSVGFSAFAFTAFTVQSPSSGGGGLSLGGSTIWLLVALVVIVIVVVAAVLLMRRGRAPRAGAPVAEEPVAETWDETSTDGGAP